MTVVANKHKTTTLLWLSNGFQCLLVAINTLAWGYLIRNVGLFRFTGSFILAMVSNVFFWITLSSGFASVLFGYYAIAKIGMAKSALFYHTGAIVVIIVVYFGLNERFDPIQILAIVLIFAGSILVSSRPVE